MTNPRDDDHDARLRILEQAVERLRELAALNGSDAVAARVLATGADRDVSDVRAVLRAHTRSLSALRETQVEHGRAIAGLDAKVTGLDAEMRKGFATLGAGMSQIVALLTNLERPGRE